VRASRAGGCPNTNLLVSALTPGEGADFVAHVRGGSQGPKSGEKVLNTRYVLRRPAEIACLAVRDPGLSGCAAALRCTATSYTAGNYVLWTIDEGLNSFLTPALSLSVHTAY
jgi:hypothetical protein